MDKLDYSYSVYIHTNKTNGKVYIGITSQKPELRWMNGNGYHGNYHFYNAIKKYGWDNFEHSIICNRLSKYEAEQMEIHLIKSFQSTNPEYGYNVSLGGSSVGKHSEETKKKISVSHIGIGHTDATKEKLSKAFTGRKLSPQWIANRSASQTGLKRSIETCKRISDAESVPVICINTRMVYKSLSEAARITNTQISHISNCCNKKRPRAGTNENGESLFWMFYDEYILNGLSEKTNAEIIPKLKKTNKQRPVMCIETGAVYSSVKEAFEKTGIPKSSISSCLHGRNKTANNLHWGFIDCGAD